MNLFFYIFIQGHGYGDYVNGLDPDEAFFQMEKAIGDHPYKAASPFNNWKEARNAAVEMRSNRQEINRIFDAYEDNKNRFLYLTYFAQESYSKQPKMVEMIMADVNKEKMKYYQAGIQNIGYSLSGTSAGAICILRLAPRLPEGEIKNIILYDAAFDKYSIGLTEIKIPGLINLPNTDRANYYQTLGNSHYKNFVETTNPYYGIRPDELHLPVSDFNNILLDRELGFFSSNNGWHDDAIEKGMKKQMSIRPGKAIFEDFKRTAPNKNIQ